MVQDDRLNQLTSICYPTNFVGVSVSLDSELECESMINKLAQLGYSITYDEINRFKQSSVQVGEQQLPANFPERFTQWSDDNVEHSIATHNGQRTFHEMEIISMTVPCSLSRLQPAHYSEQSITHLPHQKVYSITRKEGIPIHYFPMPDIHPLSNIYFKPFTSFLVFLPSMKLDLLLHIGCVQGDEG